MVLTGANESYLENCGCALNQSGGVARRATVISQIRDRSPNVLILDVGDAFPKIPQYDPLTSLEAETYLRAMNTIGFHSLSVSSNEIYATPRPKILRSSLDFPILSANIARKKDRKLVYQPSTIQEIGGLRIGIVGFSPPLPFTLKEISTFDKYTQELVFLDPIEAVKKQVNLLRSKCDLIILSTGVTFPYLIYEILEAVDGIDIVVTTNDKVFQARDSKQLNKGYMGRLSDGFVNQTLLLFTTGGSFVSESYDLEISPGHKIVDWKKNSIRLDDTIEDDPKVRNVIEEFHSEVRRSAEFWDSSDRLFDEESLEKSIVRGNAYVGGDACAGCHSEIVTQWKKTSHATAFNTLIKVHRNYYPRCVVCHSVGFGHESGYELGGGDDGLLGVQCESCHGPGKDHIRYVSGQLPFSGSSNEPKFIRRTVTEQHCLECHDQEHSPGFEPRAFLHLECAPMKLASLPSLNELNKPSVSESPVSIDGASLYYESGCATCHAREGTGTALGPSLIEVSNYWKANELGEYIQAPSTFRKKRPRLRMLAAKYPSAMPEFQLDAEQRKSLAEFLLSNPKVNELKSPRER